MPICSFCTYLSLTVYRCFYFYYKFTYYFMYHFVTTINFTGFYIFNFCFLY